MAFVDLSREVFRHPAERGEFRVRRKHVFRPHCLPGHMRRTMIKAIVLQPRIAVRIRWKASGATWFEKGMVEPTQILSSIVWTRTQYMAGPRSIDKNRMRLYIAGTDVQVSHRQSPRQIWRSQHWAGVQEGDCSILNLDCVHVVSDIQRV